MALGADYVTTAELKGELGISDSTNDTQIALAITAASQAVTTWCERDFNAAGSVTARSYYPTHERLVMVDDISTATGLVVKTDTGDTGTYDTTLDATAYQLEPLNGVATGLTGWPYTSIRAVDSSIFQTSYYRPSVQVSANWGWASVPGPVKKATMVMAARLYKRKDSAEGVLSGFGEFGPVRVGTRMDPDVEKLLMPYRKMPVPVM